MSFQRKLVSLCLLGMIAFVGPSSGADRGQPEGAPSAQEILAATDRVYAECATYQDKGRVVTSYCEGSRTWAKELEFSTAFVRPDRFRFEYKDWDYFKRERVFIIWLGGHDVATWWDLEPGVKTAKSLDLAVAAATGVSGGSSLAIPSLLMPDEITGRKATKMGQPERAPDAVIQGKACYVIGGVVAAKGVEVPTTLWIDKADHRILQIEQRMAFDGFTATKVTTYEPTLDVPLGDDCLAFNPPERK